MSDDDEVDFVLPGNDAVVDNSDDESELYYEVSSSQQQPEHVLDAHLAEFEAVNQSTHEPEPSLSAQEDSNTSLLGTSSATGLSGPPDTVTEEDTADEKEDAAPVREPEPAVVLPSDSQDDTSADALLAQVDAMLTHKYIPSRRRSVDLRAQIQEEAASVVAAADQKPPLQRVASEEVEEVLQQVQSSLARSSVGSVDDERRPSSSSNRGSITLGNGLNESDPHLAATHSRRMSVGLGPSLEEELAGNNNTDSDSDDLTAMDRMLTEHQLVMTESQEKLMELENAPPLSRHTTTDSMAGAQATIKEADSLLAEQGLTLIQPPSGQHSSRYCCGTQESKNCVIL